MKYCIYVFCLIWFSGCGLFDDFEEVPMYLQIESVDKVVEPLEGANSHDIEAVSIYADGFNIGVFPLPAQVPVIDDNGTTTLDVFAVIKNNGQGSNRIEYPFYEKHNFDIDFQPGTTVPLDLSFEYRKDATFSWIEGFEGANSIIVDVDQTPEISVNKTSDALNGDFAGRIETTVDFPRFEKATVNIFSLDEFMGSQVYIEMDYKNEVPFRIGIIGFRGGQGTRIYKIELTPKEEWTKLYLDIANEINVGNFDEFQIVFSNGLSESSLGSVFMDNIKLLRF